MGHTSIIDFRSLQLRFREPLIFSILESLEPGSSVTVVHDQDFTELIKQIFNVGFEDLSIDDQQTGPILWKTTFTREMPQPQEGDGRDGTRGSSPPQDS